MHPRLGWLDSQFMRVLVVEDEWKVADALREGLEAEDMTLPWSEREKPPSFEQQPRASI